MGCGSLVRECWRCFPQAAEPPGAQRARRGHLPGQAAARAGRARALHARVRRVPARAPAQGRRRWGPTEKFSSPLHMLSVRRVDGDWSCLGCVIQLISIARCIYTGFPRGANVDEACRAAAAMHRRADTSLLMPQLPCPDYTSPARTLIPRLPYPLLQHLHGTCPICRPLQGRRNGAGHGRMRLCKVRGQPPGCGA